MSLPFAAIFLSATVSAAASSVPAFSQYPTPDGPYGKLMLPVITNADQREFHTVLRRAITKGYDVVDGGTENERRGPNFTGHYVLVQWGCGSNCMEAALINANNGKVLRLPQMAGDKQQGFQLPTGSVDFRTLKFRTNSRLLGVPHAGDSFTYYYVLDHERWRFLKKLPTQNEE